MPVVPLTGTLAPARRSPQPGAFLVSARPWRGRTAMGQLTDGRAGLGSPGNEHPARGDSDGAAPARPSSRKTAAQAPGPAQAPAPRRPVTC
jgi:hypothetical protein